MKKTFAAWAAAICLCASGPSLAQRSALVPLPQDELQTMAQVFGMLRTDSVTQLDGAALVIAGVRGMLREGDPDGGEYYSAKDFAEFKSGRSEAAGLSGLQLLRRDGRMVLQPVPDGPALEAGVQIGDLLYAVNGTRIANLDTHQVAALLAGPQGSKFSITVFRESSLSVMTLSVERRPPTSAQPHVTTIAPGVALLRVPQYQAETLGETAQALKNAWQQDPFRRGLVLDLRSSPGGLLNTAIGLASIFLPENAAIASTQGKLPASNVQYKAAASFYTRPGEPDPLVGLPRELRTVPLVVLVDNGTVAAGEIVAAALKDNRRATLVGRKTWGRGSIQTVWPLSHSDGVKITTSYWISPNGARLHGVGVAPDVIVDAPNSEDAVRAAIAALGKGG